MINVACFVTDDVRVVACTSHLVGRARRDDEDVAFFCLDLVFANLKPRMAAPDDLDFVVVMGVQARAKTGLGGFGEDKRDVRPALFSVPAAVPGHLQHGPVRLEVRSEPLRSRWSELD